MTERPDGGTGGVAREGGPAFVAGSPATVRVAEALARASRTDVRVALYGESGVGKSHAARYLHELSSRRRGPLERLPVRDASALPRLADRGLLASLRGGTLVLEGVDETPPELQAVLVGVVEEWGVGDGVAEALVRIVSTSQRDLMLQVESGSFRRDLYYLLEVFPLVIPPLRERLEELPLFFNHFYRAHGGTGEPPPVPESFLERAMAHSWPGNVRELENLVVASLPAGPGAPWRFPRLLPARTGEAGLLPFAEAKREFEQAYVRRLLRLTAGNVTRAADLAGKARKDFYALMTRNRIEPERFRSGSRK